MLQPERSENQPVRAAQLGGEDQMNLDRLTFTRRELLKFGIVAGAVAITQGRTNMTTRDTIQGYFTSLKQKTGWDSYLSDDMTFTSFTSPVKRVSGRAAYLESTKRFYSMITAFDVRELLVDGQKACALTQYQLQPPQGPAFTSDVAEVFEVREGKIRSFDIYFDSSPFPK
jgi:ketosteroid isomerase-like protein